MMRKNDAKVNNKFPVNILSLISPFCHSFPGSAFIVVKDPLVARAVGKDPLVARSGGKDPLVSFTSPLGKTQHNEFNKKI